MLTGVVSDEMIASWGPGRSCSCHVELRTTRQATRLVGDRSEMSRTGRLTALLLNHANAEPIARLLYRSCCCRCCAHCHSGRVTRARTWHDTTQHDRTSRSIALPHVVCVWATHLCSTRCIARGHCWARRHDHPMVICTVSQKSSHLSTLCNFVKS